MASDDLQQQAPLTTAGVSDSMWASLRQVLEHSFVRSGARPEEAEDLAHDSLARVLARPRVFGIPQRLVAFALTVGRNLWRDEMRRRGRVAPRQTLSLDLDQSVGSALTASGPDPFVAAAAVDDRECLERALAALGPRHREALEAVVLGGLSYEDAALQLGVPRGTVKSRVHYAIAALRRALSATSKEANVAAELPQ